MRCNARAVDPLLDGDDALLLAPTAGGKTEAAMFPILSAMIEQGWTGVSVLYLCPLKALLNNLAPRVTSMHVAGPQCGALAR